MIANSAPPRQDIPASSNLHEPFLRRAADAEDGNASGVALGAFLTLRLADVFDDRFDRLSAEAILYQIRATGDYLRDLNPVTTEVKHQLEIVRAAQTALDKRHRRVLWPSLLAYAYWLEHELRWDEALDVLDVSMHLSVAEPGPEEVATLLQRARVLRRAGDLEASREGYSEAGALATSIGDGHSERLSRIGRAIVLSKRGNLPESERMLRSVMAEAEDCHDYDALARACQDLAVTLDLMGRAAEGVPLAFRASELYEQEIQKARALSDVGTLLKHLGHYNAAEDALQLVLASAITEDMRLNAQLELLEIAGVKRDRIGFELWRRSVESRSRKTPLALAEFELAMGKGLAGFGARERSRHHLRAAVALAEQHGLNRLLFMAEAALRDGAETQVSERPNVVEPTDSLHNDDVSRVAGRLQELRLSV